MNVGDIVCKYGKLAYIIEIQGEYATVIFLRHGMYMPETFKIVDLEEYNEN